MLGISVLIGFSSVMHFPTLTPNYQIIITSIKGSFQRFCSVDHGIFKVYHSRVFYQAEKVRVGHDAHGPGLGWFLEELSVTVPSRDEHVVFPCHCWLAEDQGDGKLERELSSTQGKAMPCENVLECNPFKNNSYIKPIGQWCSKILYRCSIKSVL